MPCDMACDHRRTDARRFERRGLHIERADDHAFFVFEHGGVDRAGDAILREFERCANVDDFVEIGQTLEADASVFQG